MHPVLVQFLNRLLRHTKLGAEEQNAFLSLASAEIDMPAHGIVIARGQTAASSCLVMQGLLAKTRDTLSGRRQITALYIPGDMPDIHDMMVPAAASTIVALTPVKLLRLPRASLLALVGRYPAIGEALWRETVRDAAISTEWVANVGARLALPRLAHLFCEMAVRSGVDKGNAFDWFFPITQAHLAETTGMSTVHVNRSLQSLRKRAVMEVRDHRVFVRDWARLQAVGEFDGGYLACAEPGRLEPAPLMPA
jgi:CRP-like cAMP-binding protein